MSLATLVTTARAQQHDVLKALDPDAMQSLLDAASGMIRDYCNRDFTSTTYSQVYNGSGYPEQWLMLDQCPVTDVQRVAVNPVQAITIRNTNTALNQRATAQTTSTGLKLVRVASGVSVPNTLTYAGNLTLQAMAAAITALGNGWTATVATGYALFPSADLTIIQGAIDARNNPAILEMFTEDLPMQSLSDGGSTGPSFRIEAGPGIIWGWFPQGRQNIRVDYTAGFATIPDVVQECCCLLAQQLSQMEKANRTLASETLGPFSVTYAAKPEVQSILNMVSRYKLHDATAI